MIVFAAAAAAIAAYEANTWQRKKESERIEKHAKRHTELNSGQSAKCEVMNDDESEKRKWRWLPLILLHFSLFWLSIVFA